MTSVLPRPGAGSSVDVVDDDFDLDFDDAAQVEPAPVIAQPVEVEVPSLSEQHRDILVFERQWWRHAGSKEQAIREKFQMSATRYYKMLNKLLDTSEALQFDPLVVGRLRRLRATRSRTRTAY